MQITDLLGAFLDKLPVGGLLVIKRALDGAKELGVLRVSTRSLARGGVGRLWGLDCFPDLLYIGVAYLGRAFRFQLELGGPWDRKWKILITPLFLTVLDPFPPRLRPLLSSDWVGRSAYLLKLGPI